MSLDLKPSHASVKAYYDTLHQFGQLYIDHEGAVRSAFQDLLAKCGRKAKPPADPRSRISHRARPVFGNRGRSSRGPLSPPPRLLGSEGRERRPCPLRRPLHHEVGHLPLHLRRSAPSRVSPALLGEPTPRVAPHSVRQRYPRG